MDFVEELLMNGTSQKVTVGETTVEITRELFVGALFTLLALLVVLVALTCTRKGKSQTTGENDGEEVVQEKSVEFVSGARAETCGVRPCVGQLSPSKNSPSHES